ncbi:hypothetical protein EMIHUDRAFT_119393 [Emiliania huxleyi CCMP1516]|uniref:protein O-GlcNAc transferase n=2 Tax=Emiliania huxleyi TaxID=2903 RepID=A0A0D3IVG1_EMIH1|nr:hypothetical protein EMIHUDRAFT_119393 [Emiliania huxleyi CCMP1516]EOD15246.1 hypothetical protein EMIHUDRAFT_119393 [Emiliania huxleyi CCMP1516]|eukprot:XP_005767675.1 hypothetical protein EMIHUDRAFT_119393 [Emiliania huxleyi CCMP1516]
MPCDRRSSVPGDLSRRGWELTEAGDADAALACHREATGLPGAGGRTWFHRARSEQRFGHDAAARSSFGRSLAASLPPAEAKEAHFQLGKLQRDAGLLAEAEASYRAVLAIDPLLAGAHILLGVVLRELGRLEESVEAYGEGLRLNPSARLHHSLGKAHYLRGRRQEAAAAHAAALALDPSFAYAHNDLGNAHHHCAEAACSQLQAHSNLGTALKGLGRHAEATAHTRATRRSPCGAVRGMACSLSRQAAASYSAAIRLKPHLCEAHKNLGAALTELGRPRDAALYDLLDGQQFLCDWRGREARLRELERHLDEWHSRGRLGAGPTERLHAGLAPFHTLVWPVSDKTRRRVALSRARRDVEAAEAAPLVPPLRWGGGGGGGGHGGGGGGGILRLGFLSSDFGPHPVVCLALDLPERQHAGTAERRAIAAAAHAFFDLTRLTDAEAARAIDGLRLHVLVNLVGHTAGARHALTHYRPAPMHYALLDAAAAPPPLAAAEFTERMAYFPFSHFVAAHARRYAHAPHASRLAHPWPAGEWPAGEEERATWSPALRRASLWLSRVSVRRGWAEHAEQSLRAQAAAHGVTGRLGFVPKLPEADFIPARSLADLMVDNRWYNAHTTGADSLWAGVPAVALQGRGLASRASGSFLAALGLGYTVAPSWKAYEDLICSLASTPERLQLLRRRLLDARSDAPFFDLEGLARAQERLVHGMWRAHEASPASGPKMHIIAARART